MKKLLKSFQHKGKEYEIVLEKRLDGMLILKDFNGGIPFSPFFHCVSDFGFIDIIETRLDEPILKRLILQSEEDARYWADNKRAILGALSN